MSTNKPNSRFSSLKVFKFKNPSNGNGGEAKPPPPLPPKEGQQQLGTGCGGGSGGGGVYGNGSGASLYGRSMTSLSLSPDSYPSMPATPVSPEYLPRSSPSITSQMSGPASARSIDPNTFPHPPIYTSTPNLGSSFSRAVSNPGVPGNSPYGAGGSGSNGVGSLMEAAASSVSLAKSSMSKKSFFKLGSLAKRNKSQRNLAEYVDEPAEPMPDDGITRPWNFQHNIHVDEGFVGLPPSWATALSGAGYSPEEIAMMQQRREEARAATFESSRPVSPASTTLSMPRYSISQRVPRAQQLAHAPSIASSNHSAYSQQGASRGPPPGVGTSGPNRPSGPSRQNSHASQTSYSSDGVSQYVLVGADGPIDPLLADPAAPTPYPAPPSSSYDQGTDYAPSLHSYATSAYSQGAQRLGANPTVPMARSPSPLSQSSFPHLPVSPHPSNNPNAGIRTPPPRRTLHVANVSESDVPPSPPPAYASPKRNEGFSLPPEKANSRNGSRDETNGVEAARARPPQPRHPPPAPPMDDIEEGPSNAGGDSFEEGEDQSDLSYLDSQIRRMTLRPSDISFSTSGSGDRTISTNADSSSEYPQPDETVLGREVDPTPPLSIDKRAEHRLTVIPPRLSIHGDGSLGLEDWTSNLFGFMDSGDPGNASSSSASEVKRSMSERPMPSLSFAAPAAPGPSSCPPSALLAHDEYDPTTPTLPDLSFGSNVSSIGRHVYPPPSLPNMSFGADMTLGASQFASPASAPVKPGRALPALPVSAKSDNDNDAQYVAIARGGLSSAGISSNNTKSPALDDGESPIDPTSRGRSVGRTCSDDEGHEESPAGVAPTINLEAEPDSPVEREVLSRSPSRSPSRSRPSSSLLPGDVPLSPGNPRSADRDSSLSTMTVTPATIVSGPIAVVRRAEAEVRVVGSDGRTSAASTRYEEDENEEEGGDEGEEAGDHGRKADELDGAGDKTVQLEPESRSQVPILGTATEDSESDEEGQTILIYDNPPLPPPKITLQPRSSPSPSPSPNSSGMSFPAVNAAWPKPPKDIPDPPSTPRTPVPMVGADATPRQSSRFRRASSLARGASGKRRSPLPSQGNVEAADAESMPSSRSASRASRRISSRSASRASSVKLAAEAKRMVSAVNTFGVGDADTTDAEDDVLDITSDTKPPVPPVPTPPSTSHSSHSAMRGPPPLPVLPPGGIVLKKRSGGFSHSRSRSFKKGTWMSETLAPLERFIEDVDPHELFTDLQEIAEGESGSVYAARLLCLPSYLRLPADTTHVAIKRIVVPNSPTSDTPAANKIKDLGKELALLADVRHENVLEMANAYVDIAEDSLWIRMELMERSLADVIGLVCEGLSLQERMIARFASDVLHALEYLQQRQIAHRDVRSDNLLLNAQGIVKLADFSSAIKMPRNSPTCTGAVGVIYWQAPEMRNGSYNAFKVDVWSLGATVWELAETEPPFAEAQNPNDIGTQWPPLSQPQLYSKSFHEFLRMCQRQSSARPNPNELLNTPFIRNACGRAVNVHLLSQCRAIEEQVFLRENEQDEEDEQEEQEASESEEEEAGEAS